MLFALGAASSALTAIQSLTSSISSSPQATGFSEASTDPFNIPSSASTATSSTPAAGATGFSQISPATMSALLAAQGQSSAATTTSASTSPSGALQDLFSQIDANGDGGISKSEFENALGAGGKGGHHHAHAGGSGGSGDSTSGSSGTSGASSNPLLQGLQGASGISFMKSNGFL